MTSAANSPSFDLPEPDSFTTGTVGEPGHRAFFLQAQANGLVLSLKLEKQQVGALAEYLDGLMADLPVPDPRGVPAHLELCEPVQAAWVVGSLAVAWDEDEDRLILVAEELVAEDDAGPDDAADAPAATSAPARARFRLTREQVAGFVRTARQLVASGRPSCKFCGGPMNPEGHACPRMN
jgi:uncharacterized repeat protein (TIGR03847 family)